MMSLLDIPVELVLKVLVHLPVQSLHAFQLVSRACHQIVCESESYLYHNTANLHEFVSSTDSQRCDPPDVLEGPLDWRAFFRQQFQIERSWLGAGPSTQRTHKHIGTDVHRLKLDEQRGFVITTHHWGGLRVSSIAERVILWSLSTLHVAPFAHCEYDNGYLVFNRHDGDKEVWRLASDFAPHEMPSASPPDQHQMQASESADARHASTSSHLRFKPWALLRAPGETFAFRFVYPTLAASAFNHHYTWDVRSGELEQIVTDQELPEQGESVCYIDVSDRHVFVCRRSKIHVYSRSNGARVLTIDSTLSGRDWHSIFVRSRSISPLGAEIAPLTLSGPGTNRNIDPNGGGHDFLAAHVSSCGSHIVALRHRKGVLVVRNFEEIVAGRSTFQDSALHIQVANAQVARYLAVCGDRFAVATGGRIYVLTLSPERHLLEKAAPLPTNPIFPHIAVSTIFRTSPRSLFQLSCLQLTHTLLGFLTCGWSGDIVEGRMPDRRMNVVIVDVCPQK